MKESTKKLEEHFNYTDSENENQQQLVPVEIDSEKSEDEKNNIEPNR